jgi:hypothetical protein
MPHAPMPEMIVLFFICDCVKILTPVNSLARAVIVHAAPRTQDFYFYQFVTIGYSESLEL